MEWFTPLKGSHAHRYYTLLARRSEKRSEIGRPQIISCYAISDSEHLLLSMDPRAICSGKRKLEIVDAPASPLGKYNTSCLLPYYRSNNHQNFSHWYMNDGTPNDGYWIDSKRHDVLFS